MEAMSTQSPSRSRSRGRPRSEQARQAVLAAAGRLVEEDGYGRVTIEAIARQAGVSKQTIYRWWSTKAEIVLEVLNEAASTIAPAPDSGSLEADLQLFLRRTVAGGRGRNGRMLAALMAEAQLDEVFGRSFRREFLAHRRQLLRDVLKRGRVRGEVAQSANVEFLVELVFAMLWYRMLGRHAPLDRRLADELSDTVLILVG
jgi:AcrR family transcriptional regulator